MSLINDAIKKANEANKESASQSNPSAGNATDGMRAAHRPAAPAGGSMTGMFIIAGVVIFVLLGGFLLVLGMKNRTPAADPDLAANVQPVVVPDNSPMNERSAPASSAPSGAEPNGDPVVVHSSIDQAINDANPHLSEPTTTNIAPNAPVPIVEEKPGPKPVVEEPAKPSFPKLKLQGIFYRLNDPTVMINGETLWTNDEIDGAKVTKIERSEVTVEFNGEKQVLRLR